MNRKSILFIDDMPDRCKKMIAHYPEHEVAVALTLEEASLLLLQLKWDEVWLDHDNMLIQETKDVTFSMPPDMIMSNWRPIACMLAAMKYPGKVILHSANPNGRKWMRLLLTQYNINVEDNGYPSNIFGED